MIHNEDLWSIPIARKSLGMQIDARNMFFAFKGILCQNLLIFLPHRVTAVLHNNVIMMISFII